MKVCVTGVNGQVGKALLASAPAEATIEAVDRTRLDLSDSAAIAGFVTETRPDLVINAAAYTAVDRAESESDAAFAVNRDAVAAFAGALAGTGGKLVTVSTDFVFDGTSPRAYRPDDPRNPLSAYGRSKAAGEDAAGKDALIVRTAWVHAAGGANFVRTMLRLMGEKDSLGVVADQIGAPTWATGLATTIWGLAAEGATGVWHHSDAGVASWYDLAVAIQEEALALGLLSRAIPIHPIATSAYPTPARRPAFSLLDSTATRELLGDHFTHWRVNLRHMLEEEKNLV